MEIHKGLLFVGVSVLLLTACGDNNEVEGVGTNGGSQTEQIDEVTVAINGVNNGGEVDTDENGRAKLIGLTNKNTPVAIQAVIADGSASTDVVWVKSDEKGEFTYEIEDVEPDTHIIINFSVDYETKGEEITLNDNAEIAYAVNVFNQSVITEEEETEEETEDIVEKQFDDPKEQIAHNVFGNKLRNYYTLEEGEIIDVYVETDIPMGITENMMKRSFEYDVVDLAEQMKDEDFTNFIVIAYAEGTDAYGNDTEASVGTITISKETSNQINYENFDIDNLKNIAEHYNLNIGK